MKMTFLEEGVMTPDSVFVYLSTKVISGWPAYIKVYV